jgi:hypothetical protein
VRRKEWVAVAFALSLGVSTLSFGQESPYVEIADRSLKSLSTQQIDDLLAGQGMGLALAAELNGYPGPKHVLELAGELDLSPEQEVATRSVFDSMHDQAVALGREIVDLERRLDSAFVNRSIDPTTLSELTEELGMLQGRLRGVHLAAHLETVEVLTEEQRHRYISARGYHTGMQHHDPSAHHQ